MLEEGHLHREDVKHTQRGFASLLSSLLDLLRLSILPLQLVGSDVFEGAPQQHQFVLPTWVVFDGEIWVVEHLWDEAIVEEVALDRVVSIHCTDNLDHLCQMEGDA